MTINPDGLLQVAVVNGYQRGTTGINDSQWHHVAAVLEDDGSPNTSTIKIYVNGIEETAYTTLASPIETGSDPYVQVGLYNYNDAGARYFKGLNDDVRIYDRALSATEIQKLAQ